MTFVDYLIETALRTYFVCASSAGKFIDGLFNGISTQKGQFVHTVGEETGSGG